MLTRVSPYPSGDKTGVQNIRAKFYIYELTARLRRAGSPTRVSMKATNPFRLYLVIQLTARPSNTADSAATPYYFKFKFKFKFRVPAVAVTKAVTAADGSAADPALGCGASRSAPWA